MRRLLALLVLVLFPAWLHAEDLVLVDGRYLHVSILEANDRGLRVKLLDGGGTVFVPWSLIHEADRNRIMIARGLKEDESSRIPSEPGVRILLKTGDEVVGRIDAQNDKELTVTVAGTKQVIPRANIVKDGIEQTQVPVTAIWKSAEYFAKREAEAAATDDDVAAHMDLARLADALGLYEQAVGHLLKVRAADAEFQKDWIANTLERLEALAKNKVLRDELDRARQQAMLNQFDKAASALDEIEKLPDVPAGIRAEITTYRESFAKKRYEYFRRIVANEYDLVLKNKIRALSRDEKLTIDEARRKLRSEIHKEVVADLAARHKLDPKNEVEKMWEDRRWHATRFAMYGSGSFVILGVAKQAQQLQAEMQRAMAQAYAQQARQQGRNGQQAAPPQDRLPKPPTKEEWWTRSQSSEREQWMMAFWAENAKKVEVTGEKWEDCERCGAKGYIQFSGSQGDVLRAVCPRCQGHMRDRGVSYK